MKVTVNGATSANLKDDPSRPAGQLAMQMHSGNEMLVYFKDIEIKHVPRTGEDKKGPTSPQKVQQSQDGTLVLPVRHATLTGKSLAYMPEWDALGFWRAGEGAEWDVEVTRPGTYDVAMEWSVDEKNAGNPFVIEAGSQRLDGKVESTKRWDVYRIKQVGTITLDAGTQKVRIKAGEGLSAGRGVRRSSRRSIRAVSNLPLGLNAIFCTPATNSIPPIFSRRYTSHRLVLGTLPSRRCVPASTTNGLPAWSSATDHSIVTS